MKLISFLIIVSGVVLLQACAAKKMSPAELFTIRDGEKLTMDQTQERLKFCELLFPEISHDSLVIPNMGREIPSKYRKYMKAYIDTVNYHLSRVSRDDRNNILYAFAANKKMFFFMDMFLQIKDSVFELKISRQEAIVLGVQRQYDELKNGLPVVDAAFLEDKKLYERTVKAYETPRSIFWSNYYFNATMGEPYYNLRNAILRLNEIFKK